MINGINLLNPAKAKLWGSNLTYVLENGICSLPDDFPPDETTLIQRRKDSFMRFATLKIQGDSKQFWSTGFENFDAFGYRGWYNIDIVTPSDQVLGIYPWKVLVSNSNISKNQCNPKFAETVNEIDEMYKKLVGAIIGDEWTILEGYVAFSAQKSKKARLAVEMVKDEFIVRGFNGNSLTMNLRNFDLLKKHYEFDKPTKFVPPPKPYRREQLTLRDNIESNSFTRTSDTNPEMTVHIEYSDRTHRITIFNESKEVNGISKFWISGTAQEIKHMGYNYWFGRLEAFPESIQTHTKRWYYFTSFANSDVTTSEGIKLKEIANPDKIHMLANLWSKMVGSECLMGDGQRAYVSSDYQLVTFDGEIRRAKLLGSFKNGQIPSVAIEGCQNK
jgi:hypothetical protein